MEDEPGGDPGHHHHEVPDDRQTGKQAGNISRRMMKALLELGNIS